MGFFSYLNVKQCVGKLELHITLTTLMKCGGGRGLFSTAMASKHVNYYRIILEEDFLRPELTKLEFIFIGHFCNEAVLNVLDNKKITLLAKKKGEVMKMCGPD